jgi:hypothetical protein
MALARAGQLNMMERDAALYPRVEFLRFAVNRGLSLPKLVALPAARGCIATPTVSPRPHILVFCTARVRVISRSGVRAMPHHQPHARAKGIAARMMASPAAARSSSEKRGWRSLRVLSRLTCGT